ncbi:MAG: hypothetical protein SNJ78_04270 [Spirochaetales bacterium]
MLRKWLFISVLFTLLGFSLLAQDLTIDYQFNVAAPDRANYFTFKGPVRYMLAEKDTFDAGTGASQKASTKMFMPYLFDVKGKQVFPTGLRGLFLFAVAPDDLRREDNVTVNRAPSGVITIQYVHRGTAYKIETDTQGLLTFPKGNFVRRTIGFIQGQNPQVLSSDFSSDGTAARVDWARVWNASIAGGKEIRPGVPVRTGAITDDNGVDDAFFQWQGTLQVTFERNILKIAGGLNAVKR